jgi:hypothetical protein
VSGSARFGGFSSFPFGASFLGGQTRAFLMLCFVADVFCGANRLNLRYRRKARKPRFFDSGYDLDFMKIDFYRLGFGFKFSSFCRILKRRKSL